jgi:hypothetical protein
MNLGDKIEADFVMRDGNNLRVKNVTAGNNVGLHARLRTKDAGHVLSLRSNDGGGCFIPVFGNPAAACHGCSSCGASGSLV